MLLENFRAAGGKEKNQKRQKICTYSSFQKQNVIKLFNNTKLYAMIKKTQLSEVKLFTNKNCMG